MKLVVDAGVIIKAYLPESGSAEAEKLLVPDNDLHAPEIAVLEVGNILWKKQRTGEIKIKDALKIAEAILESDIAFHTHGNLVLDSLTESSASDKPIYDWAYVTLANRLDCQFVTADRRFFLAVRKTLHRKRILYLDNLA